MHASKYTATGKFYSVREFVQLAFKHIGVDIVWSGNGVNEIGKDSKTGKELVKINPKYFRPSEVELLLGDPNKAKKILNWEPKTDIKTLVKIMMDYDNVMNFQNNVRYATNKHHRKC